jgi:signal transduction histidine kinase
MNPELRALVVEDSEDDYGLLQRQLAPAYQVVSVRVDTAAALDAALRTQTWDVVFSDWYVPGFGAQEALAVLDRVGHDIPFIIVSGTVGEEAVIAALQAGAKDFIVKGNWARLLPAIDRELREVRFRAERTRMQEQLVMSERMVSLGTLAAGVAHEINNPLSALLANLALVFEGLAALPPGEEVSRVRGELEDVQEAATRIRDVARDLKTFSRSPELGRELCDVQKVMESSLRMASNELRHRAKVVTTYRGSPQIVASESRLGQVFLNLLVNAAQAIEEGHAHENQVLVTIDRAETGAVLVEIADSGSGMAPEVMASLFTPFFTTKPPGIGTGLGLAICHRIVTELGGEIRVTSVVGRGTRFTLTLPAAQGPADERAAASQTAAPGAVRRGRVLVVDDEPMIVKAIDRTLRGGHEVVTATFASEALERIQRGERFDVILCDLMMPEMTGMDLHAELVRLCVDQAERMIFLTGGVFTGRAEAFLGSITNLRLDKPFDTTHLRDTVNARIR